MSEALSLFADLSFYEGADVEYKGAKGGLQLMFQVLGAGDKAGSGIDKIRASWLDEHWQSPVLRETWRPDRVVLELPMLSLFPSGLLIDLQTRFGEAFATLSTDELQTVATAALEQEISNHRLQELLSLHRTDITDLLRGLVQKGFLKAQGLGRGTRYALGEPVERGESGAVAAPILSPHVGTSSLHVGSHAGPAVDADPDMVSLEGEQRVAVERVAAGQAPRDLTRRAILILCQGRFLTARQLGKILHRNAGGLRDRFLAEMVSSGQLEQRFPGVRHHRDQAYRTAAAENGERGS